MFSILEQNAEKKKVKLSLFNNFLISIRYWLDQLFSNWDIQCKYRQFNLIQEQWIHFELQKIRSIFKNIFNTDKNVRILSACIYLIFEALTKYKIS